LFVSCWEHVYRFDAVMKEGYMCASGALPGLPDLVGLRLLLLLSRRSGAKPDCHSGPPTRVRASCEFSSLEVSVSTSGTSNPWGMDVRDPGAIASSLAELTSGWTPAVGLVPETLTAARAALCVSLIAGKSLQEIHASNPALGATPLAKPQLDDELRNIAANAIAASRPNFVAVTARPWTPTSQHVLRWWRSGDCEVVGC
jgi:hypothetical protein